MLQKSAQRLEIFFVKNDNPVHAGIHGQQVIGWRLHNPGDFRLGIGLFDGIAHRQRMNDVADGAELHDEDIFYVFEHHFIPLIFSITFVVERPATICTNSTRPP